MTNSSKSILNNVKNIEQILISIKKATEEVALVPLGLLHSWH